MYSVGILTLLNKYFNYMLPRFKYDMCCGLLFISSKISHSYILSNCMDYQLPEQM